MKNSIQMYEMQEKANGPYGPPYYCHFSNTTITYLIIICQFNCHIIYTEITFVTCRLAVTKQFRDKVGQL